MNLKEWTKEIFNQKMILVSELQWKKLKKKDRSLKTVEASKEFEPVPRRLVQSTFNWATGAFDWRDTNLDYGKQLKVFSNTETN